MCQFCPFLRYHPNQWIRLPLMQFIALLLLVALFHPSPILAQDEPIFNPDQCFAVADEPRYLDVLVEVDLLTGTATEIGEIQVTTRAEAIMIVPDSVNQGQAIIYAADEGTFGKLNIVQVGDGSQRVYFEPIGRFGNANGTAGRQRLNDVDGLTYDILNDIMYGVQRRGGGQSDLLFIIDPVTGRVRPEQFNVKGVLQDYLEIGIVKGLHDVDDIAIHPETRKMYGVINDNGTGGVLVQLNPETGELIDNFTIVDSSNQIVDDLEGLSFSSNLSLYGSTGLHGPDAKDSNRLFKINLDGIFPSPKDPSRLAVRASSVAQFDGNTEDIEGLGCLTTPPGQPQIDVEKSTNGIDADEVGTGPSIVLGCPVTWKYTVTNTGSIVLADVALFDDKIGAIQCPSTALNIGESMVCSVSEPANQIAYANLATVTATSSRGDVTDNDPSHYSGLAASIVIEKATNGQDADSAPGPFIPVGEAVTWSYVVTNTGDVRLKEIQVTDDQLDVSEISCSALTLAPGESMICTAVGTAQPDQYTNMGKVEAMPEDGCLPVSDTDPSHYYGVQPGLTLEKSTNGIDADLPQEGPTLAVSCPVRWQYEVTNTGNTVLEDLILQDDKIGPIACPGAVLDMGESMTCTAEGSATEGAYANIGTVTAVAKAINRPLTATDPSHYNGQVASINIEKSTNGEDADAAPGPLLQAGAAVNWTYLVTNSGSLELKSIRVVDDQVADLQCPQTTLAAGESMICTATGIAIPGQYTNLATVIATAVTSEIDACNPVTDSDPSHYFGIEPDLDIAQTVVVDWSYQVTNTGAIKLENVLIDGGADVSVDCPQATLAVGESMSCDATGPQERFENTATVTANPAGRTTRLTRTIFATPITGLTMRVGLGEVVASQINEATLLTGSNATWGYQITNEGTFAVDRIGVAATNLYTSESQPIDCPQTTLAPGETMLCTLQHLVAASENGTIGTVSGYPVGSNQPIAADAVSLYQGVEPATVGGRLFIDNLDAVGNVNGLQDPGERALPATEIEIDLYRFDGTLVTSGGADNEGNYEFTDLLPDDYYIVVRRPEIVGAALQGYQWTEANQGNNRLDSDVNARWSPAENEAQTEFFRLSSGEVNRSWDVGFRQLDVVGEVFVDENGNGQKDENEAGFSDATVHLEDASGRKQDSSISSQGVYRFNAIDPGVYTIKLTVPDGYIVEDTNALCPEENPACQDPLLSIAVSQITDIVTYLPIFTSQAAAGGN